MFQVCLFCICFTAGVAVHRRYQDDAALNDFADAALALVRFPVRLLYSVTRTFRAAPPSESAANGDSHVRVRKAS